jgi:hypothetical protein
MPLSKLVCIVEMGLCKNDKLRKSWWQDNRLPHHPTNRGTAESYILKCFGD